MNIIGRPTSDTLKSLQYSTMTLEQAYPDGGGALGEEMPQIGEDPGGYPSQARILYWYHPDYIQNVDLVTDLDGEAYELFLYNPWGEELHHWSSNSSSWTSPYRFNAKEVDPETGLTYYGARYYKPTTSIWFSVDPKAHWYPSFSQYNFTLNNPINLLDPNGQWIEGAGFFRNLFNSDQKIRAHDEAAKHADGEAFEVKGGWRATWSSQNNDVGNDDVNMNNLHISDFTKGGRDGGGHNSIMDLWNSKANNKLVSGALNAVRGVFNSIVLTGGAVLTPITAAIHNGIYSDDIDRWSAQPWYLSKEFDLVRLPEGKEGYGEVMKSTIGAISLGIPSPKGLTVGDKGIIILGKSTVKSGLETGVDKATEE
jgi:RHS repeat-associated protein